MDAIIFGGGRLGSAIAAALIERGDPPPYIVGRPRPGAGISAYRDLPPAEVCVDATRGDAVLDNVNAALATGTQRFVIATTGWSDYRSRVEDTLRAHDAQAVAAANFSPGVALFARLIDRAVELFGPLSEYDPYLLEWHRAAKADRPSGTAQELSRRIIAAHPRKRRVADADRSGPAEPDELAIAVIRAGSSPGMHVVGFDAPGETVELRLTARDRSAYASGALAAADWLVREHRTAGIHGFDEVVDELLGAAVPSLVPA
jgi:4-hydroxy-tetrahydrodipicolinate reductase